VSAVFVGTVRDIQPVDGSPFRKLISFDVEQAGRGIAGKRVTVESGVQTGASCGFTFQLGQRYVVYGRGSAAKLTTDMCAGTKLAAEAAEDLAFLKELAGPARGVRIFGTVRRIESDLRSFSEQDFGAARGARIEARGARGSHAATVGADGRFDMRDLPPGTYNVTISLPTGLALAGPPLPPEEHAITSFNVTLLNPCECSEVWFRPKTDSRISGVVLEADGRPADAQTVDLIAVQNAASADKLVPHVSTRADQNGRFTFAYVASGTYLLGVNLKDPQSGRRLDRRSYHPGVTSVGAATVVRVEAGGRIQLEPFRLAQWPQTRRISGVVLRIDGAPAPDARLELHGARTEVVKLDADGRFVLSLPYGARYVLRAQSGRFVTGRMLTEISNRTTIDRDDRDGDITIVLRAPS
jgi:hypothetical protein